MRWVGRGSRRSCRWAMREGGRFELRFSAPADVGALVEAAVSEARDALFGAGTAAGDVGRCVGGGVCPLGGVGGLPQPAGVVSGVCASGCRGWLVDRAAAAAGASGGQADLCGVGAAGVAAGGGAGQCRAGVADRAGADPPVGAGPGPGLPLSRVRRRGRIWRSITWSTGPTGAGRTWRTWSGCARSITTRTTGASSRSAVMRTVRRVGVPGPGRVPDRAGPDLRTDTAPDRPTAGSGSTLDSRPGSAGQVWTIGVSTEPPGRSGPGQRAERPATTSAIPTKAATPMRASTPSRTNRTGCGPESDRRWPTRARPGRVLHSKWVTFHEGPALLL